MEAEAIRLAQVLRRFDESGALSEADYGVFRAAFSPVAGRRRAGSDLLDGLINLFFERHVMDDVRRRELLAFGPPELLRVAQHRFRQVIFEQHDDYQSWHALRGHVRDVLETLESDGPLTEDAPWPVSLRVGKSFDRGRIQAAVRALLRESGRVGNAKAVTAELLRRYADAHTFPISEAHDAPESIRRRLDGQRLAASILRLLGPDERSLLQHVLEGESVEAWAEDSGRSRAAAYRLLARLKTVCRLEFAQRSNGTQLEALEAIRAS